MITNQEAVRVAAEHGTLNDMRIAVARAAGIDPGKMEWASDGAIYDNTGVARPIDPYRVLQQIVTVNVKRDNPLPYDDRQTYPVVRREQVFVIPFRQGGRGVDLARADWTGEEIRSGRRLG